MRRIPARQLTTQYQVERDVQVGHTRKLARDWNDLSVSVLEASERADGTLVLLDGLQRWHTKMALLNDPSYVFDVKVHTGLDLVEEARIFLDHNQNRKNVSAFDKFRVGLVAEDPACIRVDKAVRLAGYEVGVKTSSTTLSCVATLIRCIDRRVHTLDENQERLVDAVYLVGELYADAMGDAFRSEVVEGMFLFLERWDNHPDYNHRRVITQVSKHTVRELLENARARSVGSNRVAAQMAEVILDLYNMSRSPKKLA